MRELLPLILVVAYLVPPYRCIRAIVKPYKGVGVLTQGLFSAGIFLHGFNCAYTLLVLVRYWLGEYDADGVDFLVAAIGQAIGAALTEGIMAIAKSFRKDE